MCFHNYQRVVSRNVLFDDGLRQVVEVEQESIWKFLCWSGTFSVNLVVDQNRRNHTVILFNSMFISFNHRL